MSSPIFIALTVCAVWTAQEPETPKTQVAQAAPQPVAPKPADPASPTAAEQITKLQRTIEADQKHLERLQVELKDPASDYNQAEVKFKDLDEKRAELKKQEEQLRKDGKKEEADKLIADSASLEESWKLAKDQFNLAIQERQTIQEKIVALEKKIQQDKVAFDKMTGVKKDKPPVAAPVPAATPEGQPAAVPVPAASPAAAPAPAPAPAPAAEASTPVPPVSPAAAVIQGPAAPAQVAAPPAATPAKAEEKPVSKELVKAKEDAKVKEEAAREATEKAQSLTERLESLRKNIPLERKLLDTARRKADQCQVMQASLDKELKQKLVSGADEKELTAIWQKIDEAEGEFLEARSDVSQTSDRLHELQAQLSALQGEQLDALREADRTTKEAKAAEAKVARLQNPFTPHNILQWILNHVARLMAIVIGMFLLRRMVKMSSSRIVKVMARSGERGTREERENRAQTLVGVFRNSAALIIFTGGTLMLFDEVGIPVVPLMGGAAVLGLAVAFGAQNLIKDYFSGFMVLLEDQYGINDVVKIGDIAGLVEKITLRVTVLRDLQGTVHFIPHGAIDKVSNLTHGWSRAYFEIGVAYKEDCDEVMRLLVELGKDLRKDPKFSRLILEDPEMLGVDAFADSAVVIKFFIKTRPLQQWTVRRELLRRIKRKFDDLNIEIPFPHRTVYHRHEGAEAQIEDMGMRKRAG
ncbi:MAG: mechanosensitive ion channel domain-containing protein [Gemmataceae bacterium]